jgi:uncharacterized membrane protein
MRCRCGASRAGTALATSPGVKGEQPLPIIFLKEPSVHAILVFSALPLFLGALLSDWAYAASYQVQWTNFASWLIAGGLVFAGVALLWAVIDHVRPGLTRNRRSAPYLLVLLASVVLGFINALVHARDAWAAMPAGLWLSLLVLMLMLVAGGLGAMNLQRRVTP